MSYFAIGIEQPKYSCNVGGLFRSAVCFGAKYIFTIGKRYERQPTDTVDSLNQIPLHYYNTINDFLQYKPHNVKIVGVEITDGAIQLETFIHPRNCIYVLGAENAGLSEELLSKCDYVVKFAAKHCLNVSTAGSIVMYDRQAKLTRKNLSPRLPMDLISTKKAQYNLLNHDNIMENR